MNSRQRRAQRRRILRSIKKALSKTSVITAPLSDTEQAALDAAGLRNAFDTYTATEAELRTAETNGTLTQKLEDDLVDRLERLWWLLTDEEQEIVRTRG